MKTLEKQFKGQLPSYVKFLNLNDAGNDTATVGTIDATKPNIIQRMELAISEHFDVSDVKITQATFSSISMMGEIECKGLLDDELQEYTLWLCPTVIY